ncbi:hypothetical protein [Oceanobacillus salinisoli]|uniref:hypothetical protein n=1 Tax=Oceanobacillus salinisoli TaxID=2678611 RepID=UPI0012E2EB2D|nr:hypothetical protein [Oceanobacillus salinisoli]
MLIISSVGVTLLTMAYLEKQGKISINHTILYILLGGFAIWSGWWGIKEITKTFLLNIS